MQGLRTSTQVIPLSAGGPLSIKLKWTPLPGPEYMWYYITKSYVSSVLYYNGQVGALSGTRLSNVQLDGTNSAYQNFTIPLFSKQDSGYLDANLMISTMSYLYYGSVSSYFYCPSVYYSFVSGTLGISNIQLDSSSIRFAYTSM